MPFDAKQRVSAFPTGCTAKAPHILARIFACLAFALLLVPGAARAGDAGHGFTGANVQSRVDILVLHSFHRGQKWSDDVSDGIVQELARSGLPVNLHFEYMDMKTSSDKEHLENLRRLYEHKYAHMLIALVIACDDDALSFLLGRGSDLFSGAPVVFCGIKYFDNSLLYNQSRFTGVLESADVGKTLEVAAKLHPKADKLLVVVDSTTTSISIIQSMIPVVRRMRGRFQFEFTSLMRMPELLERLRGLREGTLVLLVNFTRDKAGRIFSMGESARLIAGNCPVPIYTMWDNYLGTGSVGGMMVSAKAQGTAAATLALKVLGGGEPLSFPVARRGPNGYMFDHDMLVKFGIKKRDLPQDSVIINQPTSFYAQYKRLVWLVTLSILGLALVVVVLSMNILGRKKVERHLKKSTERLQFLLSMDQAILEARGLDVIVAKVLDQVRNVFGCHCARVLLFDYQAGKARVLPTNGGNGTPDRNLADYDLELLGKGEVQVVADTSPEAGYSGGTALPCLRTPMLFHGELLGVLSLTTASPQGFDDNLLELGREVAGILAIAIQNERLWRDVHEHGEALQRMSAHIIDAQEAERKRISMELHDELGQALTAVSINLTMMESKLRKLDNTDLAGRMEETVNYVETLAEQLHDLSLDLRPPMLDDLGLVPTLRWYLNNFAKRLGLSVAFNADEELDISPSHAVTLYRLTQEAMNNVAKYAEAAHVRVDLHAEARGVRLVIRDDGQGFDPEDRDWDAGAHNGLGLIGMRERLDYLKGRLSIDSKPGQGTAISAWLPE